MHLSLVLVVLAVLSVSLGEAAALLPASAGPVAAATYRGGAKSNKGSRRSPIGAESSKKGRKPRSGRQTAKGKRPKASSFRTKLEKIAKQGQSVYKDVFRRAKVLRSSAFESMLLKATWPSNDPVQPDILGEIIKYSIPAFKYSDADGEDDPYYMTLHKLWTKMSETDWRTTVKSLYILHAIARDSQPADCAKFSAAMKDMVKTRNPKNPEHRYFSVDAIAELDEAGAPYEAYVTAYGEYVLQRNKLFTARFEELKALNANTTAKKALSTLKKAQQLVAFGLKVEVTDKKLANAITGYAAKQTGNDLRDLYALMGEKIQPFLSQGGKYVDQQAVGSADILALLQFYQSAGESVKGYLSRNAKLHSRLRIKFPADVESKGAPSSAALAQRVRELSSSSTASASLSGGSTSDTPSRPSGSASINRQKSTAAAGEVQVETPRGGATTVTKRVLQRADRPLTPEEARLSVELAGNRAYALSFGTAAVPTSESVTGGLTDRGASSQLGGVLEKASGGAYSEGDGEDGESDDDDGDDDEEDDDGEEDSEDGGCDDAECEVEDGPQGVKKGARGDEEPDEVGESEEAEEELDEGEDEGERSADGVEDGDEEEEDDVPEEADDAEEDGEDEDEGEAEEDDNNGDADDAEEEDGEEEVRDDDDE